MNQLIIYLTQNASYIFAQFVRHFLISAYGVLFACLVSIPLGFFMAKRRGLSHIVIGFANVLQTIPSLALLAILMFAVGAGVETVVFTVFLYSLLPILKNTVAGINAIPPEIIDASKGMGMTKFQLMTKIEFPLSLSIIMGGIRNALVVAIGVTAVGTFVGAGGLGDIITRGISVSHGAPIILAGAIPTAAMAVIVDFLLGIVEDRLAPHVVSKKTK